MTNSTPDSSVLDEQAVEEILARADAATKGPWAVWDSCSWRRIGTVEPFADGNVICPVTQNDGHPDLLAKREDLEFAAKAREDVPALCNTVKQLRAENKKLREGLDEEGLSLAERCCGSVKGDLQSQLEQLRAENEKLKKVVDAAVEWRRVGYERKDEFQYRIGPMIDAIDTYDVGAPRPCEES